MRSITSLCMLCFVVTGFANAQEIRSPANRSDYVSDASFFVGTYVPTFDHNSPEEMAAAGNTFIAALGDKLHSRGALALDDPERHKWTNLPPGPDAGGVRLGEMNEAQLKATCDLIAALFSREGYEKFCQIMLGDDQLLDNGRPQQGFGTASYAAMVFGKPSPTDAWAFQLDGHHLALNVAVEGKTFSISPSFVGSQPEEYVVAGIKRRPFAHEVDGAYALVALLNDRQRSQAVLGPSRDDIRVGAGHDGEVPELRGVECSSFDEGQRDALFELISNWVSLLPKDHAAARMEQLHKEFDKMKFSWNGQIDPRSDMSYAIQGPTLIIEFACQGRGNRPLDHLHSIYRDPTREYGKISK